MPQGAKHDIHGSFWSKQRNWWLYPHDPGCSSSVMSTAYRLWCSFFHSKGSLKKTCNTKAIRKSKRKTRSPNMQKNTCNAIGKTSQKKGKRKSKKKKQRLSFFVVFFFASAATQRPKEKTTCCFRFSIASFLLFVCVVFLLFSKVWFSGVLFWFAFVLGLFPSFL